MPARLVPRPSRELTRRLLPLAALLFPVSSCAPRPAAEPPPASEAPMSGAAILAKNAGAPPHGVLVTGWLTPEEADLRKSGYADMAGFRRLLGRLHVAGEVDFAATPRVPYQVIAPPGAIPLVILDVGKSFWATFLGGGSGLVGLGEKGGGDVTLAPNPRRQASGEPCSGPRYRLIKVNAPGVEGKVHNPVERRFCAYLPRSYEDRPTRRYPLVLWLPGLGSTEMARLRGKESLVEAVDAVARETSREAILVGVDTSTRTGSTYLEDSPVTGAFDSFLAGPGLEAIDRELRTLRDREARGLVGNSTGGLNAMSYGMRHPERFSAIGACSPDALDLPTWLFAPGGREIKPWIRAWTSLEDALGGPGQMTSYGADWSPDSRIPRGFAWPFEIATGRVEDDVLARWIARSPAGMMQDRSMRARVLHAFGGRIYITVARGDEFDLHDPARRFSDLLFERGIDHTFTVTGGGHGDGSPERLAAALRFVIDRLTPAR